METVNENMDLTNSVNKNNENESVYERTLIKLKVKASAIDIRTSTLHLIIKYVMELVEETQLKGIEQKEMAIKLIKAVIVDLTNGEDERVLLQLLNDGTISNMIGRIRLRTGLTKL